MGTALMGNLELILWENPNNPKLSQYIEANNIIHSSQIKGQDIKLEELPEDIDLLSPIN